MNNTRLMVLLSIALGAVALPPADAAAQSLGVYRWQLQPSCNILELTVVQVGATFSVEGFDDHCGGRQRTGVVGSAFLNPDGTVGIGLTTVLTPGGAPVHIHASVHVVSLSGPWRDSTGNFGGFVFTPAAGIGGSPRAGQANGIAPDSVTFAQLASDVAGAIPPRDQFQFQNDGTFFVFDVERAQTGLPLAGFGWLAATGRFIAGIFDLTTGGRSRGPSIDPDGHGSWGGGLNPDSSGSFAFAFGDHADASGNTSFAIGRDVTARGDSAIAMGALNGACGDGSVALGEMAVTSSSPDFTGRLSQICSGNVYDHSFVFSDGSAPTFPDVALFPSGGDNTFLARATGGVRFLATTGTAGCGMSAGGTTWACSSDRNLKERFEPLDGEEVLRKVAAIPVQSWSFIDEPSVQHVGPVAQDFHAAFGLGSEDTSIGYTDINGINMRAIQALEARTRELAEKGAEIDALKARLDELERAIVELRRR